jgi:GT2 family glycosyltransferase
MLEVCLDSAIQLDPAPGELVVTIDGAEAAAVRAAEVRGLRVVVNPGSPGVSAARNAGARGATRAVILFSDSDILLPSAHIARAAEAFAEAGDAAAVIGSYDGDPAASGVVSRYRNLLHHFTHQHGSREARTFWAGCGAVRREAFEAVGGFDESFRQPSVEDIDLGYRLRRAGCRIRLVPGWQVKHLKGWRFRDLVFTDIGRRAIPWTRLLRREGRLDNDLNTDRSSRWSAALVSLGAALCVLGAFRPLAFALAVIALLVATILNARFYRYLGGRGGWAFAAASIPLHWLYFLGAAAGYVCGHLSPAPAPGQGIKKIES